MSRLRLHVGLSMLAVLVVGNPPVSKADGSEAAMVGTPTIEAISVEETEASLVVVVRGEGEFASPRVRTGPGNVRVWLPGYFGGERFARPGDGHRVRRVRTRPGDGQTALVRIDLADRRQLPADAVDVSRADGVTRIALAKAALPTPPPPPPRSQALPEPAPAVEVAPPAQIPSPSSSASVEAAAAPPSGDGKEAPVGEGSAGEPPTAETGTQDPEDRFPWDDREERTSPEPEVALGSAAEPGAMTGPLLVLTMMLGLVYLGVRFLQSRNPPIRVANDIAVVATKRLGPKHQLVLVRAMGKDHLLSIQGTTTRRLGTARSPDPDELEASFEIPPLGDLPVPEGDDEGPGLSPAAWAAVTRGVEEAEARAAARGSDAPPAEAGGTARQHIGGHRYASQPVPRPRKSEANGESGYPAEDLESRFGARLFEFALDRSRAAAEGERLGLGERGDLSRASRDEEPPPRSTMLGRIGLRRGLARGGVDAPTPRDDKPAAANSDAVAGLLRLRQRTGS